MSKQEVQKREAEHTKDLEKMKIEREVERAILDKQAQQLYQQNMILKNELEKVDEMLSKLQEEEIRREHVQNLWCSLEVTKEQQAVSCWGSSTKK